MNSQESLNKRALELIALMKTNGLPTGKKEGQWRAGGRPEPTVMNFEDIGEVDDFTGVFFVQTINGEPVNFFNPPEELGLEHDDSYGEHEGYWKKFVPREIKAARTLIETGISAPKSSAELRSWDSRKISKYLLGEAENYEALYVCIIPQLENVGTPEARIAIDQLTELMETKTDPVPRKHAKVLKQDDEEEDVISQGMERMSVKKSPPKPKTKVPSPKKPSPKKPSSPPKKDLAKFEKLITVYKKKLEDKQPTATVADSISRLAKELGIDDDELGDKYDFYGFGRSRLQPNRRKSRRRSNRKVKTMKMKMTMIKRRMSGVKRKVRRTSGKSLKKSKRRTSKRKISKKLLKKCFGSAIYGLQGGMQSGPIYQGVYPMTLKVNETLPNLNNVKRTYLLNEFGAKKIRRGSKEKLTKKQSKKQSKIDRRGRRGSKKLLRLIDDDSSDSGDDEDDEHSFGCGTCGSRSFGCGCGGDKDE